MSDVKRVVRDGESDLVAVEEPLEIRVDGEPIAVTMRTPGPDEQAAQASTGIADAVTARPSRTSA
jgi:formate dehydrogenase assembly factor FdhD